MKDLLGIKRFGFTLAEVLITLGIIGVVAAMTIPNLIANTRSAQYRSGFKKAISTLSQAGRMAQAQYDFDYAGISSTCVDGAKDHPDTVMTMCSILNGTLTGATYYKNASDLKMNKKGVEQPYTFTGDYFYNTDKPQRGIDSMSAYVLADGMIIMFSKQLGSVGGNCTLPPGEPLKDATSGYLRYCIGYIDVNGVNLPNKEVSCTKGSNSLDRNDCIVNNSAKNLTDIYPFRVYDGIVVPATAAARYVLRSAK